MGTVDRPAVGPEHQVVAMDPVMTPRLDLLVEEIADLEDQLEAARAAYRDAGGPWTWWRQREHAERVRAQRQEQAA